MTIFLIVGWLILTGGLLAYNDYFIIAHFILGLAIITHLWRLNKISPPPGIAPFAPMALAVVISFVINPTQLGIIRLMFYGLAVIYAFFSFNLITDQQTTFIWLAAAAPFLWLLLGQADNRNIQAIYYVIFSLAAIQRRSIWAGAAIGAAVYLGSRGALLALAAGVLVLAWPHLPRRARFSAAPAGLAALAVLITARPVTAAYRLDYWRNALAAWLTSPWVGLGPGGLYVQQFIPEPGTAYFQVHAHNALITWLAATGLLGLLALAVTVYLFIRYRYKFVIQRWQWAIFAALAAHSMVDDPLWWPGPLLLLALIFGTIDARHQENECAKIEQTSTTTPSNGG
jgi:hypothetical protein